MDLRITIRKQVYEGLIFFDSSDNVSIIKRIVILKIKRFNSHLFIVMYRIYNNVILNYYSGDYDHFFQHSYSNDK